MKKTFKLIDLDCANCAAKMEREAAKIEGVSEVSFNFMSQKMKLDADDEKFDEIVDKIARICKKIEPDCRIVR